MHSPCILFKVHAQESVNVQEYRELQAEQSVKSVICSQLSTGRGGDGYETFSQLKSTLLVQNQYKIHLNFRGYQMGSV